MGLIKNKLNNLKEADIYSVIMFALFKLRECPEYSTLSELCFILDKEPLLKLCEIFGGMTITIPTVDELELMTYALLLYQYVDIDNLSYEVACEKLKNKTINMLKIKNMYIKLREVLNNYSFSPRSV